MTKLILIFGSLLLLINTAFGMLISSYLPLNWISVDIVLVINTFLLYKTSISQISNGFKVSFSFVFPFLGMISAVLAILSPEKWINNYYLIGFILILFFEVTFYLIAINIKLRINNK